MTAPSERGQTRDAETTTEGGVSDDDGAAEAKRCQRGGLAGDAIECMQAARPRERDGERRGEREKERERERERERPRPSCMEAERRGGHETRGNRQGAGAKTRSGCTHSVLKGCPGEVRPAQGQVRGCRCR